MENIDEDQLTRLKTKFDRLVEDFLIEPDYSDIKDYKNLDLKDYEERLGIKDLITRFHHNLGNKMDLLEAIMNTIEKYEKVWGI